MAITDPTDVTGCALWLDTSSLSLTDGDPVSSWSDETANGNNATGTTTRRPLYRDGTQFYHSQPMLEFDGSDDRLVVSNDASLNSSTITVVVVAKFGVLGVAAANANQWLINRDMTNPATWSMRQAAGLIDTIIRLSGSVGTTRSISSATPADEALHTFMLRYDGTDQELWVDNKLAATQAISGGLDTANGGDLAIGNHPSSDAPLKGFLGDVIVYDNAVSDTDKNDIFTWAESKYVRPASRIGKILSGADKILSGISVIGSTAYLVYWDETNAWFGYATAPTSDPHNWTDQGELFDTAVSGRGGCLKFYGSTYYLFYDDRVNGVIRLATGASIAALTDIGSPVILSGTGTGNEEFVRHPDVLTPDEGPDTDWHMVYDGRNGTATSGTGALYHATSSDGEAWARDTENNPILSPSAVQDFETDDVGAPSILYFNSTLYLLYAGFNSTFRDDWFPSGSSTIVPHQMGVASGSGWGTLSRYNDDDLPIISVSYDSSDYDSGHVIEPSWYLPGNGTLSAYVSGKASGASNFGIFRHTVNFLSAPAAGGTEVSGNVEQLTLTTNDASIDFDVNVNGNVEALSLTTFAASIGSDTEISANTEALSLTTYPAALTYDVNVLASFEALTLTQNQASIQSGYNIDAGPEALALTTLQASIAFDVDVLANTEALTLTTYPATIAYGVNVGTNVEELTLTTNQATLTFDVNVSGNVEALTLTTYQAQILTGAGTEVSANVEALELTTYQATIQAFSLFAFPTIDGFNPQSVIDPLDKLTITDETGATVQVQAENGQYHASPIQFDRYGNTPNMYLDSSEDYYIRLANRYGVYKYGFARNSGTWSKVNEIMARARSLTLTTNQATISLV